MGKIADTSGDPETNLVATSGNFQRRNGFISKQNDFSDIRIEYPNEEKSINLEVLYVVKLARHQKRMESLRAIQLLLEARKLELEQTFQEPVHSLASTDTGEIFRQPRR